MMSPFMRKMRSLEKRSISREKELQSDERLRYGGPVQKYGLQRKVPLQCHLWIHKLDIVDLVEANGCPVKEERGARMVPVSDHASDVTGALERKMKSLGVKIFLNEPVRDIVIRDERAAGIILEKSGRVWMPMQW